MGDDTKEALKASTTLTGHPDPLKLDFRKFLWLIWQYINLPDPTPLQYDIAHFLQHGPNKICIEAFRGVGKSFITSAFVLWLLYCNPQLKIMVVSASKNRADNFVKFVKQLLSVVPELHHLEPTSNQRSSNIEFDVGPATADQSPSVFSKGIDSQLAGGRADIIVSDDVEIPNNSGTLNARDKLLEKTKEYSAIIKPLPHARIIYLGTPQTEESIYNKLPVTFKKRIWPALVPTPQEKAAYGSDLSPMIEKQYENGSYGAPTDPKRFDPDDLIARRAEYGAAGFQLQFMLNTQLSDAERYPLKLKNLIVMDVPPVQAPYEVFWLPNQDRELRDVPTMGMAGDRYYNPAHHGQQFAEYQHRVMGIDPSGRGADETSYAVGYMLAGNVWVPAAGGMVGGYEPDTLKELAIIAKVHKVKTIVVETNFGDGMFEQLLKPVLAKHGVTAEVIGQRHSTMKEKRILDTLEPVVSGHKLIVDPSVIQSDHDSIQKYDMAHRNDKSLFYQMTHICREKNALRHDDRVDVLAMLVAYFVEIMDQDANASADTAALELLEAELARFTDNPMDALGFDENSGLWNADV